jgi:hypothetical protein
MQTLDLEVSENRLLLIEQDNLYYLDISVFFIYFAVLSTLIMFILILYDNSYISLPHRVDKDKGDAKFIKAKHVLSVTLPIK